MALARFEESQAAALENAELRKSLETRKLIERAKGILIKTGLSEEEAYLSLQRQSRDTQKTMRQIAEGILSQSASKTGG